MNAIKVNNLLKNYSKIQALKGISFEVESGELFGFIGPDGAGKTTLFRILVSLLDPSSGDVSVLGLNPSKEFKKLRPKLGYMPGKFSLYQDLSIEENLKFYAGIFNSTIEENYYLIKDIYEQIKPFKDRQAGKLSGGMKQKLALCCALIHKPELLVLDEPTTGVDAVSRVEFWDMLKRLKESGITIIVSTPYMDEASRCDRVALIQNGVIFTVGKPQDIISKFDRDLFGIKADNQYLLLQALQSYQNSVSVQPFGEYVHYVDKNPNKIEDLKNYLVSKNLQNIEIIKISPSLEDVFIQYAERAINE